MNMLNQEQRKAIGTLQDAHGAVMEMINYLKSDAPAWVAENARKVVNDSIEACKVTTAMLEEEECENTYILPLPTASVWAALMVLLEKDEGSCSAEIVKQWMVSEAEQAVGKAILHQMATGGEFPPQMQWAVNALKIMKEV